MHLGKALDAPTYYTGAAGKVTGAPLRHGLQSIPGQRMLP
jgi:hypothetical protein